jgi:TniQ
MLIRHPAPIATEGLLGYVLRLAEENGYPSPWRVYALAGLKQSDTRTTGMKVEKLALIAKHPACQLDEIAFAPSANHSRSARLLGHLLVPTDLGLTNPKVCPQCIAEKGFIEAHWHLELMVACPIHHRSALSTCPKCGKRLSWFRPGLLECKCGGNLQDGELHSISEAEASLLDVIRRKVLTLPTSKENPAALPQDQLMAMNLRSLLSVIRTLGKHRMIADGGTGSANRERVVSQASRVLMNWPRNFIDLFTDLGRTLPATPASGVGKQFTSIYSSLFKSKAIRPREQTDFLKIAFLDFAMNHWGRGFVDHKLVKQLGAPIPKRYLTRTEFAAQIGVQPSTAARFLKGSKVTSRRVKCGMSERVLVDTNQSAIPRTAPGKISRNREAARRLGLSVSVLQALKREGIYEVKHLLPTKAGFHELDIEAFRQKLMALASCRSVSTCADHECITLLGIMQGHHDSLETKMNVLRAVFSNEIASVGNADGTPGGLLLDGNLCKEFVEEARNRAAGNAITPAGVAKALGCDPGTVPGLVQLGLLHGIVTPVGLRITHMSVEAFKRQHVCLARVAKSERISSRALMKRCEEHGINILLVAKTRKGGPQPFISIADWRRLCQLSPSLSSTNAVSRLSQGGGRSASVK